MGLRINVKKTVGMVCHPFRASGVQVDKTCTRMMTEAGISYMERQQDMVNFLECGKDLARGSLAAHRQNQNGVAKGFWGQEGDG